MTKQETRGRPTKLIPEVVTKLEAAFNMAYNDTEACLYAGISRNLFYHHLNDNHEFRDKITAAKVHMNLKAKGVVVDAIGKKDLSTSKWWLEHRASNEFGNSKPKGKLDLIAPELRERYDQLLVLVKTLEKLICLKYRGVLFLMREQERQERKKLPKDFRYKSPLDGLLSLSNPKLADYVEMEVYATGQDRAGVRTFVEQRHSLLSDAERILDNEAAPVLD